MADQISKIRRILYSFNVRSTFTHIKRFAKPKEDPFAKIAETLTSLLPKPKEEVKFKGKVVKYRAPVFRTLLYLVIILAVLGVVFYIITNYKITPYIPPLPPPPLSPVVNANVIDNGFLDAYDGQMWYALLAMSGEDLDYANVSLSVFRDFAPEDVFILRSIRKDATRYDEFKELLKSSLELDGISVTEITVDDLMRMPGNMKITLVVPSGYLPSFFLGQEDPGFDIVNFTKKGNVVIFIGRSPMEHVISRTGELVDLPAGKVEQITGLSFLPETSRFGASGVDKYDPLFKVQQAGGQNIGSEISAGTDSSSVTWGGGGYALFLPTTLDSWWGYSGNKSATYLSEVVANAYWGHHYALGTASIAVKDRIMKLTNTTIFTSKFKGSRGEAYVSQAHGRLFIRTGKFDDKARAGKMIQVTFQSPPRGSIGNQDTSISSAVTGDSLEVQYSLKEPVLKEEQIFLKVLDSQSKVLRTISLGIKPLQTSSERYPLDASFPSGEYMLRLEDSAGNMLAQSYMHLSSFTFDYPAGLGWDIKYFVFNVHIEGNKAPYTGKMNPVKVSLDGRDEKEVKVSDGKLEYSPSFFPGPGNHTFKFVIGADTVTMEIPYSAPLSFIQRYWYMIIIVIVVFGIAFAIKRPERSEYTLDVPDFPPLQSIAIPVKKQVLLDMFDTINKDLKWQYTPLSVQDLKAGFRKLSFRGRPINVGDYNLEHLLDTLSEEGYLKHALDYYGLVSWEKGAKKSIYCLAIQRALRDLFVVEGIPFIPFGQRTDCDTVVSFGGEKILIHIYEDDSVIQRAVQATSQGRTVIVFEDEQAMRDFTARIHSSSEANVIFKMLLDDPNGNIFLTPINKLVDVLNKKYTFFYY